MKSLNKEQILEALREVEDPEIGKSIVDLQMVKDVVVDEGNVKVDILLTVKGCPLQHSIGERIKEVIHRLDGVKNVEVQMGVMDPKQLEHFLQRVKQRHPLAGLGQVDWVVAVASGKGGVGKSTIAVELALALESKGNAVGLFDADVWGPSVAKMLTLQEMPVAVAPGLIEPPEIHNIKVISFGSIVKENQPVIWRGPMVHKAIEQLLLDSLWGQLDYLVVDLPPGTGDVAISICQLGRIEGVFLVTTPQEISILDVQKACGMFRTMGVPIIGIVENMSYFVCGKCGAVEEIFGSGGAEKLSTAEGVPVVARIPLDPLLRKMSDEGQNFVLEYPERPAGKALQNLADRVMSTMPVKKVEE